MVCLMKINSQSTYDLVFVLIGAVCLTAGLILVEEGHNGLAFIFIPAGVLNIMNVFYDPRKKRDH